MKAKYYCMNINRHILYETLDPLKYTAPNEIVR